MMQNFFIFPGMRYSETPSPKKGLSKKFKKRSLNVFPGYFIANRNSNTKGKIAHNQIQPITRFITLSKFNFTSSFFRVACSIGPVSTAFVCTADETKMSTMICANCVGFSIFVAVDVRFLRASVCAPSASVAFQIG